MMKFFDYQFKKNFHTQLHVYLANNDCNSGNKCINFHKIWITWYEHAWDKFASVFVKNKVLYLLVKWAVLEYFCSVKSLTFQILYMYLYSELYIQI